MLTVAPGASRLADCLCPPHMYHYDTLCLPCPIGFFCPLNGTRMAVQCRAGGPSLEGSASSLDCECPYSTHGLLCENCADHEDCAGSPSVRTVMELSIQAWAPSWGEEQLRLLCLDPHYIYVIYSVLGISAANDVAQSSSTPDQLFWNWLVTLHPIDPNMITVSAALVVQNITECLGVYALTGLRVEIQNIRSSVRLNVATPFASRSEWDGNMENPSSTCIEGYEALAINPAAFGPQTHCFPCLNGTKRPRRDPSPLCSPCMDPNTHAPYLGMGQCVCVVGYEPDGSGVCAATTTAAFFARPWWYVDSPFLTVSGAVGFGLVVVLFSVLLAHCFG